MCVLCKQIEIQYLDFLLDSEYVTKRFLDVTLCIQTDNITNHYSKKERIPISYKQQIFVFIVFLEEIRPPESKNYC